MHGTYPASMICAASLMRSEKYNIDKLAGIRYDCGIKKLNVPLNMKELVKKMNEFDMDKIDVLLEAYKAGRLGGEKMPEDENPGLDKSSNENYIYFTLLMALNYLSKKFLYTMGMCQ